MFQCRSVGKCVGHLDETYISSISFTGCLTEELGILLEISIPCWFWTRCEQLQRKFRAVFHVISVDRRNEQLNTALLRISAQLGQESCQFRVGGLVPINNNMLGKVS